MVFNILMKVMSKCLELLLPCLLAVAVFLFWLFGYPEWLSYHEEMQLFRWSWDYFISDIAISGGFADYVSEFLVQFYYLKWLGALLLALLFLLIQRLTWLLMKDFRAHTVLCALISLLVPVLLTALMGDINVMLSFPVAVMIASFSAYVMNRISLARSYYVWADILVLPIVFWLAGGGASWLYVAVRFIFEFVQRRSYLYVVSLIYLFALQMVAKNTVMRQWPEKSVCLGVHYYFIPSHYVGSSIGFDSNLSELLTLDCFVREERWSDIIAMAESHPRGDAFSCNCLNLALSQERLLADRMFEFPQCGEEALLMKRVRDNMSNMPSMEAFWRLGMVNSCLRYASDLQESILSTKKSVRLTKRIAECHVINGNYKVARKNLALLKQTLFYKHWAIELEKLIEDETQIDSHPVYGKLRRYRFKSDLIFWYPEKEKILGQLFLGCTDNKMALDYFLAELLIKGDTKTFMGCLGWAEKLGGYSSMPRGYMDAVRCIQTNGNLTGSPYREYLMKLNRKQ